MTPALPISGSQQHGYERPLQVALLQIEAAGNDTGANAALGEAACREAARLGADIALFPEMWSAGYTPIASAECGDLWRAPELWPDNGAAPDLDAVWGKLPIPIDGEFVSRFRRLARELEMAIAITFLQSWDPAPRNALALIDRTGELVLTYAKVHTCDFGPMEAALTPGDAFPVATLRTAVSPVRVGAMICYDREFPEAARLLMLGGAEIILVPNACTLDDLRLAQTRVRAFENMVGIAVANYPAPQFNGNSAAYHPLAYAGERESADDLEIVRAGTAPEIAIARFDLERIRRYRAREVWGNAFRRPHRYRALSTDAISPPFVRVNADGTPYEPERR